MYDRMGLSDKITYGGEGHEKYTEVDKLSCVIRFTQSCGSFRGEANIQSGSAGIGSGSGSRYRRSSGN